MVDMNKDSGEGSKTELDKEFGEGNLAFIQCDVRDGTALRGEI